MASKNPSGVSFGSVPQAKAGLPLVLTPNKKGFRSAKDLAAWLADNQDWAQAAMAKHGALLLRGFGIESAADFERAALAVDDDLKDFYVGTSPRIQLTDYTFTASELPWYYPIPQHCEMTYIKTPPRRLFFCSLVAAESGGETPLADARRVYNDMDPSIRAEFEEKGVRTIRNYAGSSRRAKLDLWQLKRWQDMFKTEDRARFEAIGKEQAFEVIWKGEDDVALITDQPAMAVHPDTGEKIWFNHAQVYHLSTAFQEPLRIARHQRDAFQWAFGKSLQAAVALKRRRFKSDEHAMHCVFGDGSEIPDEYMNHVRDVIWQNMVFIPWQRGDIFMIDNYAASHGRMPFKGDRFVAVAWS